jgi:predicted alternative tryptophan synthase beta-subunit
LYRVFCSHVVFLKALFIGKGLYSSRLTLELTFVVTNAFCIGSLIDCVEPLVAERIKVADQSSTRSRETPETQSSGTHLPTTMTIATDASQESDPTPQDIAEAYALIKPYLHKTPILTSTSIDSLTPAQGGLSLFFKAEVFQKTGAFKFRGASHAIARLSPSALEKGVVTHSSGNHSAALACAARDRGVKCHVVMVLPLA